LIGFRCWLREQEVLKYRMNHGDDLSASLALIESNRLDLRYEINVLPLQIRAIAQACAGVERHKDQPRPFAVSRFEQRRDLLWSEHALVLRFVFQRFNRQTWIHADVSLPERGVERGRENRH